VDLADETAFAGFAVGVGAGLARFGCLEHLHAVVAAIADIQQAIICEPRAVQRAAKEIMIHAAGPVVARPKAKVVVATLRTS
jgi:hypothetical protein